MPSPSILWLVAAIWLAALPTLVDRLLRLLGLVRPNFRGDRIPVGYGLIILLWSAPMFLVLARVVPERRAVCFAYVAVMAGMSLLGLADDLWGDRSITGLRGHIRAFFAEGVLTTGFAKLALGSILSTVVPRTLFNVAWPEALLDGAVIALCANALNLLDLRPGRACAAFLLAAAPLTAFAYSDRTTLVLLLVMIPTLVVYERDARARAMLGDTGSNLLGGALGLALILALPALAARVVTLAALIALHILAERVSISRIIETNPILRRIDGLTGKR